MTYTLITILIWGALFAQREPAQVDILVESALQPKISARLNRYVRDLECEGYQAAIIPFHQEQNPESIRALLKAHYDYSGLVGAVIIGKVPPVYFRWYDDRVSVDWYKDRGQGKGKDVFPTYFYYGDLTGKWSDRDEHGNFQHISGDRKPEVWIGVIRTDALSGGTEESYINRYLDRNHEYRKGSWEEAPLARGLGAFMVTGFQRFNRLWRSEGQILAETNVDLPGIPSIKEYLSALSDPKGWLVHYLTTAIFWDREEGFYSKSKGTMPLRQVMATSPKICFFSNIGCCMSANFEQPDYWSGSLVFKTTHGLATLLGSSNDSGSICDRDWGPRYYAYVRMGWSIGDAYMAALQEFDLTQGGVNGAHVGGHIIGDPTLRIHPCRKVGLEVGSNRMVKASSGKARHLNDGSLKKIWQSEKDEDQWAMIDLGARKKLKGTLIIWDIKQIGAAFAIETSSEAGGPWSAACSVTENKSPSNSIVFNEAVECRFIRLLLQKKKERLYVIQEWMVFEEKNEKLF